MRQRHTELPARLRRGFESLRFPRCGDQSVLIDKVPSTRDDRATLPIIRGDEAPRSCAAAKSSRFYPPHLVRDIDRAFGYLGNLRNCWGFGLPA